MSLTVISHFYNEQYLLPFWLKYHKNICDHGILIDYASTDSSVDIIKSIVPDWEIIPSRNAEFDCVLVDREVMDIETRVKDWKVVLNTTEFLIHPSPLERLKEYREQFPDTQGFLGHGIVLIDNEYDTPVDPDELLPLQRFHGVYVSDRNRMMHDQEHGAYQIGRHDSARTKRGVGDIFVVQFGFSPWPQVKHRRLQVQTRIPKYHHGTGFGTHHFRTDETVEQDWKNLQGKLIDMRNNPLYAKALDEIRAKFGKK